MVALFKRALTTAPVDLHWVRYGPAQVHSSRNRELTAVFEIEMEFSVNF